MARSLVYCVFFLLSATPAMAKTEAPAASAIVSVVNDEVITSYDVNARVKFVLVTTKI